MANKKRLNKCTLYDGLLIFTLILYSLTNILSTARDSASFRDVIPPFILVFIIMLVYRISKLRVDVSLICYIGIVMLSTISSLLSDYGFSRTIVTFALFMLLTVMLANFRYSDYVINKFSNYYIGLSVICGCLIIASWIVDIPYTWRRYSIGIIGLNKNPNYINSIILMGFALVLNKISRTKIKLRYIVAMVVMLCGVALTGTRAAILTIFLCAVFMIMYHLFIKGRYVYMVYTVVGLVLLAIVFAFIIPEELSQRYLGEGMMSDDERTVMWEYAFSKFLDQPILGLGLGGTTKNNIVGISIGISHIHNVLLEFLCDCGIIAFFLFIFLIYRIVKRTSKQDRFLIYVLSFALYFPILFQNGLVGFTFWWPLAILEIYSRWSQNKGVSHEE